MTMRHDVVPDQRLRAFRLAYAEHRAAEGRGSGGTDEALALPYLRTGPHASAWQIRARSYETFIERVIRPLAGAAGGRPLRILDAGAGNGWLCHRLARMGHKTTALDVRTDHVDGLGAGADLAAAANARFSRVAAQFEALPVRAGAFDVVVFNAALHYALSLPQVLGEAVRTVTQGGRIVVLDSPFYDTESAGAAMVAEKRRLAAARFGARANDLLCLPFVEFLTRERLADASAPLQLQWYRHRVRYPLRYEVRPLIALLRRQRTPSRFDVWEAIVP